MSRRCSQTAWKSVVAYSASWYLDFSRSSNTCVVISARYRPAMTLSVFRKISRSRDWPQELYFRLKRSKRWNVRESACMSNVSMDKSYLYTPHPRV